MFIDLSHTAKILTLENDEVMFLVQGGRLTSHIDEEDMTWQFELDAVLALKAELDREKAVREEDERLQALQNNATVFTVSEAERKGLL